MLYAFVVAAILITLAELGDKTQLLTLALAARYRAWQVLAGITLASAALHLLSATAGRLVGGMIPQTWLAAVSGALFIGFGIWTLRGPGDDGDEEAVRTSRRLGPVLGIAGAFFIAEMGDKTQIMSMAIAADPGAVLRTMGSAGPAVSRWLASMGLTAAGVTPGQAFWGVWAGSTLGMVIADGVAVIVGSVMGRKLPERLITRVSGSIFILFGLVSIASAFAG